MTFGAFIENAKPPRATASQPVLAGLTDEQRRWLALIADTSADSPAAVATP